MANLLKMHRIQEYYFTVESKNIPERCNRRFSLFTSCLIDLVYIIAGKRMQILEGGVGVATKFVRKQFALCNRRVKIIVDTECLKGKFCVGTCSLE